MRLSSRACGVSQSNLEQPSQDLLAPVRHLNDLSIVSKAWWTVGLLCDGAWRTDGPVTMGRPWGHHKPASATCQPTYRPLVPGRIDNDDVGTL